MSVDLPAPFSPSRPCTSPRRKLRLTPFNAFVPANSFSRFFSSTSGVPFIVTTSDELEMDFFTVEERVCSNRDDEHQSLEDVAGGEGEADHVHPGIHHIKEKDANERAEQMWLAF